MGLLASAVAMAWLRGWEPAVRVATNPTLPPSQNVLPPQKAALLASNSVLASDHCSLQGVCGWHCHGVSPAPVEMALPLELLYSAVCDSCPGSMNLPPVLRTLGLGSESGDA